ncbi:trypsin delta-like [Drosophila rhopaloa]|uniref:Peptidase S1 domain-containing protein n=1 Tax=Drosophila rhopaloa TaxID=1041015 RepID=A0ABM5JE89_DRORH|nr:trypsin delta-like [Drosophila rhopaloa]
MFHSLVLLQFVALPWLVIGEHRIIGGNTESIKVAPWYGSLIANSKLKCGGVLVKNNYFLTAAKCVDGFDVSDLQIRLGTSSCESGGSKVGVCKVKVHPQYSSWRFDNNLALLRTCEPLVATDEIKPIESSDKIPEDNSQANVTGCGARRGSVFDIDKGRAFSGFFDPLTDMFLNLPKQLHSAEVQILNQNQCSSDWKKIGFGYFFLLNGISELTICTKTSGKGASVYDMGDPLVVDNKLVGILSKPGCSARPDVYANLNQHKTWLDDNTKE